MIAQVISKVLTALDGFKQIVFLSCKLLDISTPCHKNEALSGTTVVDLTSRFAQLHQLVSFLALNYV